MKSPFRVAVISDQIAQVFAQVCEVVDLSHLSHDFKHHLTRNLVQRLERLGYAVTLTLEPYAA